MAKKKKRKKLKIKIKPSKVGSFSRWCRAHGFSGSNSSCVAAGKRSKSASIRKKATFAGNSAKWGRKKRS